MGKFLLGTDNGATVAKAALFAWQYRGKLNRPMPLLEPIYSKETFPCN
jgi:hypothetical protein